jgi:hypothetical protein
LSRQLRVVLHVHWADSSVGSQGTGGGLACRGSVPLHTDTFQGWLEHPQDMVANLSLSKGSERARQKPKCQGPDKLPPLQHYYTQERG